MDLLRIVSVKTKEPDKVQVKSVVGLSHASENLGRVPIPVVHGKCLSDKYCACGLSANTGWFRNLRVLRLLQPEL